MLSINRGTEPSVQPINAYTRSSPNPTDCTTHKYEYPNEASNSYLYSLLHTNPCELYILISYNNHTSNHVKITINHKKNPEPITSAGKVNPKQYNQATISNLYSLLTKPCKLPQVHTPITVPSKSKQQATMKKNSKTITSIGRDKLVTAQLIDISSYE